MVNVAISPAAKWNAVRGPDAPPPQGSQPVEDLHPGRNGDEHGGDREGGVGHRSHARGEHVMRPHPEAEEPDEHAGVDHHGRAEEGLAREGRQHLGHDAEGGQDQDVDLRMAEDPEEVLPQVQIAPRGHVVEVSAEEAIEHEKDEAHGDGREGEDDQELDDQAHPHEHRHTHEGHAGRAHVQDGDDEVHPGHQRRRAQDLQSEHPEVDGVARRVLLGGEAHVPEPPAVGGRSDQEARVEKEGAPQEDPVGERVQAGEGHVARADLERDEVVEERGVQRHDGQEHHGGAVHGEERVVEVGAHQGVARPGELQADHERLEPSHEEEQEGGGPVQDADALVVDGGDPAPETGGGWHRCRVWGCLAQSTECLSGHAI